MRHVQLISHTDQHGNLGLIVVGTPDIEEIYSDSNGGLIAHDLLEHQNGLSRIGDPRDELEALGGVWYVRGRDGHIGGHYYTPHQSISHDIVSVANDAYHWTPEPQNTRPHYCDDDFTEILEHARKGITAEDLDEDFPVDAFIAEALHHLRTGYRKAERRGTTYQQFRAVQNALAPYAQHLEVEGQRFRLSYGNERAQVTELHGPFDLH